LRSASIAISLAAGFFLFGERAGLAASARRLGLAAFLLGPGGLARELCLGPLGSLRFTLGRRCATAGSTMKATRPFQGVDSKEPSFADRQKAAQQARQDHSQ